MNFLNFKWNTKKKYNELIKKIVKIKPKILNEYAKKFKLKDYNQLEYLQGKIDLIEELLDGKG